MNKQQCLDTFNSFIDRQLFSEAVILPVFKLGREDRIDILDTIGLTLQIQFGKKIAFISTDEVENDVAIKKGYDVSLIPKEYPPDEYVFLVDVRVPYFDIFGSWEANVIHQLLYYQYTVFGFSNKQLIKIYQN